MLEINSLQISQQIEEGDDDFAKYVPQAVFEHIKQKKLFGYGERKIRNNCEEVLPQRHEVTKFSQINFMAF